MREKRIFLVGIVALEEGLWIFELKEEAVVPDLRRPIDKVQNVLDRIRALKADPTVTQRSGKTLLRAVIGRGELDRNDLMLGARAQECAADQRQVAVDTEQDRAIVSAKDDPPSGSTSMRY